MSTILDALRKVEEEKRTQVPDVRTRLLSTSPRFDFRTPRRSRLPWIVGGGLVFSGIALGVGLMLWRLSDTASVKEDAALSFSPMPQVVNPAPQQPTSHGQRDQRHVQPEPQTQPTPVPSQADSSSKEEKLKQPLQVAPITPKAAVELPPSQPKPVVPPPATQSQIVASTGLPNTAETATAYNPWTSGLTSELAAKVTGQQRPETPQSAAATVQRSPFVNSSPSDRIVAPPPMPSPSAAPQVAATPKPTVRRPSVSEKNVSSSSPADAGNASAEKEARSAVPPASTGGETPSAPPGVSLSFLQWSADPEKRVASIKVGTSPATIAHEGDSIEGMTVVKIRPDAVELRSGNSHYVLKAR